MGVKINNYIVKDVGILMGLLTLCVGLWHVMLNFHLIILDDKNGLVLRLIGVVIITVFSYLPYYFLYKIIKKMKYKTVGYGVGVGFFIGDFLLKFDMIFNFFQIFDFVSLAFYSIFFVGIFILMGISDYFVQRCEFSNCMNNILNFHVVKKVTAFLLNKKKI